MASNSANRFDIKCEACGNSSIVVTDPESDNPSYCPICGEEQETEASDDSGGS